MQATKEACWSSCPVSTSWAMLMRLGFGGAVVQNGSNYYKGLSILTINGKLFSTQMLPCVNPTLVETLLNVRTTSLTLTTRKWVYN